MINTKFSTYRNQIARNSQYQICEHSVNKYEFSYNYLDCRLRRQSLNVQSGSDFQLHSAHVTPFVELGGAQVDGFGWEMKVGSGLHVSVSLMYGNRGMHTLNRRFPNAKPTHRLQTAPGYGCALNLGLNNCGLDFLG